MSTDNQDQDFEKLQRLLKLKRHELPPPRYFNDFSSNITARIRAGEGSGRAHARARNHQASWLQRFWQTVAGNPAVSGIASVAVCGLVVLGVVAADKAPPELPQFSSNTSLLGNNSLSPEQPKSLLFADNPAATRAVSSTNPMAVLPDSLFNNSPMLQTFPTAGRAMPAGLR